MGRYSVKRYKTKRRVRDLDLIFYDDMKSAETRSALRNQEMDETKPGLGQFYCIECARYFENKVARATHLKGKVHKRRVKELNERPYTPLEAQAAAGTNLELFVASVEKYKLLDAQRKVEMAVERAEEEAREQAEAEREAAEKAAGDAPLPEAMEVE